MSTKRIEILERALLREKKARKAAEKILEQKALELYKVAGELKKINNTLENLLSQKDIELKGFYKNIVDAYCVMDMHGNVIEMNNAAIQLLKIEEDMNTLNLTDFTLREDKGLVINAFKSLKEKGEFKDLIIRVVDAKKAIKQVHINASLIFNENGKPFAIQGIARDITEDQKLKKSISESESRLKILIENLDSGILLEDENRNIIVSNKKFCEIFSVPVAPELLIGQDCKAALENLKHLIKNSDEFVTTINQLIENKKEALSQEIKMANGKVLLRNYTPIFSGKELKGHLWSYKDVTVERQIQENLVESENNLKTLIQNLDHGIYMEDENGIAILANKKLCEQFYMPMSPDLITGQDFSNGAEESKILFTNPEEFYNRYQETITNKKVVIGDELEMVDGKILERNYFPIFKNNKFSGHLWSFNDVTLKRSYDKNIETQKQKYSNIIANMNLGLVEIDTDNNIIMINQSFMDLSGYTKEELIGRSAINFLIADQSKKKASKIAKSTFKEELGSFELEIKNKKGELKSWLISTAPNYDEKENVTGSIGVVLDISDLKNLQNQKEILLKNLEKSNEELEEYAHIVSHDLKSPLRSIFALVSWLKEDNQDKLEKESLENIKLIESTLEKMEQLITDILNYSSVTSNTNTISSVNLNTVVEGIKQLLFFPDHITLKIKNTLPIIQGDKVRFQQLFQNLISNGIRYIDKEIGEIIIDVQEFSTHYKFSVSDNGIGIEKEYFDKIFKIFHSLNENKESTGIGLSIVKKIVSLYNGEVWLDSKTGEGTTFYFTIKK